MDGEPPQEEDFSQIPLVERSQHKNWKARLSAYNDIISKSSKTASDTDPFFRPYVSDGQLLRKWCLDANAVAQEKGIEAVLAIAQYSGESCARIRSDVVPALVDKALGATRAGTKKKGADLCAMFVEVENGGEGVMTDVMVGFDSKQPKVVAGSITCLKDIIESFGVPIMGNIKPLLKTLSKIFGHTDKNVRAEGTSLVLALYTYLGPALLPSLADLKPVQMSDLQKSFDSMDGEGKGAMTGRPTRHTRKVQREREATEAAGGGGDDDAGEGAETEEVAIMDPKSLLDPINVFSLFPSDLEDRLSSAKWKDRLEVLEECNKVLSQPQNARISDSNIDSYGSLASTLGTKCKSDANVNVVMEATKVIEGLARGIGKPFGRYRGVIMVGCLERLKERKTNVTEALGRALDALFSTVTLSDIVEDVLTAAKSKNPQVREGTLKFLHRSLQTTTDTPGKDQVKPMAETLVSLLSDSIEPVRSGSAECLGTLMKILGERAFNPYIEGVGELQMAKVKDAFGKAEIKYRAGGAKAPAKPAAAPKAAPSTVKQPMAARPAAPPSSPPIRPSASTTSSPPMKASGKFNTDLLDEFAPPAKAPPARFARPGAPKPNPTPSSPALKAAPPPAKKPAPAAAAAGPSKPTPKAGSSKTLAVSPSEPVKFRYSPEDAAAQAADVIPGDYHTKLADAAWKVRLEAAEEMVKWVDEEGGAEKVDSEVLFRFLGKTPGWGEKNFQVSAKLYQVMTIMADKSPSFGKPSAALAIGPLSDKLGDLKLRKPSGDALAAFAEKTSLAFVLAQAYESMQKQKAVKAQADALTWVKQQLIDFGVAGIPLRDLISFVKTGLQSPNAAVRSSATQVLVTVRIFVGADISGFLEDLNPQLLTTINKEFDKVAGETPPEPTKTSADLQDAAPAAGGKGKAAGGSDPLDDLIPRVDLDKLVNQTTVVADARSDAWKVRKEAFEALNALLDVKSNSRLKSNMGEIGGVLKKAMSDTNLSVKMLALGIVSKIATGMGTPFEKYTKLLTAAVASVCADQKATTRSAGVATLTAMADACGSLDSLYQGIGASLESPNPALRAAVLGWLAERLKADSPPPGTDMTPLAASIIVCLEDRNGDVRKGASAILPFVVQHAGYDFVMDQTSNLKPASKATIVPLINNARAATPSAPPASAPVAKSATSTSSSATPSVASTRPKIVAASRLGQDSPKPTSRTNGAPARSLAMKALAPSARPASSQSDDRPSGLPKTRNAAPRPVSSASHAPSVASSSSRTPPFISNVVEARTARLKKDATRWVLDASPKSDTHEYLQTQMEPHTPPEILSLLFSKDHRAEEDYMVGLLTIAEFYDKSASTNFAISEDELSGIQLANVDLALKYSALRLLSNNTQMANRCLEVVGNVIETMQGLNERFSDAEAKLFVPALVTKLGDSKFGPKLLPIFEALDKVIAGSQVVQLLVQHGLEDKSAGKSCKNESLALIEKAYRKRGSILRTKDDRGFYEVLARCISDSGTRNAALSVMALLQLQGGSNALNNVIDAMPQASKDMLANRRATMTTAKSGIPPPAVARTAADVHGQTNGTPGRLRRPGGIPSPAISRLPRETASTENSPAARGIPRSVASPSSRLPKSNAPPSPSTSRTIPSSSSAASASTAAATRAIPAPSGAMAKLQRPTDVFAPVSNGRSLQPLGRASALRPTNGHTDPIVASINDIRHDDPAKSVDALKKLQIMLNDDPDQFLDSVQTLADALVDELERAFTPPERLLNMSYFRLVKHIIQTFNFSSNQELMRRLTYDDIYAMISGLSLRLVQADRMGGTVQELVQFINMILISTLATPDRLLVFKAMFRLLLNLTKDFAVNQVFPEDEVAAHADLVIKCLWKRCKILDDDFRSGRLDPGKLLGVLEEFVQGVGPSEWRKRAQAGVALGELPLRTVKSIIQRIVVYCKENGVDIYEMLVGEFGDGASDATVYYYVFRLVGADAEPPTSQKLSPLLPSSSRPPSSSSHTRPTSSVSQSRDEPSATVESEPERLVKNLLKGKQTDQIDALYSFLKRHPEREEEVNTAMSTLLSTTVGMYIRRALEQRKSADNPSPARHSHEVTPASPMRSPARPESLPTLPKAAPRRSMGPRPSSVAVDKSAPIDAQIAQYKNVFHRSSGYLSSSQSPEPGLGAGAANRDSPKLDGRSRLESSGVGEPLMEITEQVQGRAVNGNGPRASDVD